MRKYICLIVSFALILISTTVIAAVPTVSFVNLNDGDVIKHLEGVATTVYATATNSTMVELYVDEKLFSTSEISQEGQYRFDISSVAVGNRALVAVAYASTGESAQTPIMNTTITKQVVTNRTDLNMNNKTISGLTTENTGVKGTTVTYPERATDDFYLQMGIGGPGQTATNLSSGSYFQYRMESNFRGKMIIESDFMLTDHSATSTFGLRAVEDSAIRQIVDFVPVSGASKMRCYNGSSAVYTEENLTLGTWYKIKWVIDITNNTYSFYLDGNNVADNYRFRSAVKELFGVRIMLGHTANSRTAMAFDNFKVDRITEYPYVNAMKFENALSTIWNSQTDVPLDTIKITATLNGVFNKSSVSKDTVKLFDGDVELPIKTVTANVNGSGIWSNELLIEPDAPLDSVKKYVLRLYPEHVLDGGETYNMTADFYFKTAPKAFDITNVNYFVNGSKITTLRPVNGDRVTLSADVYNTTGTDKDATVILMAFSDGVMYDMKVKSLTSNTNTPISTQEIIVSKPNTVIKAFFINGWKNRMPLRNELY